MINWELLTPRNLFIVAAFSLIGYMIYNHFSKMKGAA